MKWKIALYCVFQCVLFACTNYYNNAINTHNITAFVTLLIISTFFLATVCHWIDKAVRCSRRKHRD